MGVYGHTVSGRNVPWMQTCKLCIFLDYSRDRSMPGVTLQMNSTYGADATYLFDHIKSIISISVSPFVSFDGNGGVCDLILPFAWGVLRWILEAANDTDRLLCFSRTLWPNWARIVIDKSTILAFRAALSCEVWLNLFPNDFRGYQWGNLPNFQSPDRSSVVRCEAVGWRYTVY